MPIIEIDRLSYTYPDGTKALDGITLSIDSNESVGVAGPNGAGKTTLINHLCGYTLPQDGTITIAEIRLSKKTLDPVRRKMGVVFQNTDDQLFMPTVMDDVAFGLRSAGMARKEALERACRELSRLGLDTIGSKAPFHLSQGQKRFVAFAGVMAMEPEIIVMDEPTADLDPRNRRLTIELINSLVSTRLIVSHDLDFLWDTCSRVILMNNGRIAADGPAREILASGELLGKNGLEVPLRLQS